jgi:PKHD-type hydroxylase
MSHIISNILSEAQLTAITDVIKAHPQAFESGKNSAGWHAKDVKNNEQASADIAKHIRDMVEKILLSNAVFNAAAQPKKIIHMLVSRYKTGMAYGLHIDDPLMGGSRTDLSFTLFLNEPESYDGGELVIAEQDGDSEIKLPAGSLYLYPSTTLHHVREVMRGERLVVAGWVRSFIRDAGEREILFDLENLLSSLRDAKADRAVLDHVLKIRANLIRKWVQD